MFEFHLENYSSKKPDREILWNDRNTLHFDFMTNGCRPTKESVKSERVTERDKRRAFRESGNWIAEDPVRNIVHAHRTSIAT